MAMSTDVVLEIVLSHLNVQDLLDCRYVSKLWNKAASSALRKRSTMIKDISKKKTLKKLEECLEQSLDFPFTGLIVDRPWKLSSAKAMEFFKNYGATFTRLRLGTSREARLKDQAQFVYHLTRLYILELGYPGSDLPPELLDSAAGQEDARILNLPSLRTLRISSSRLNEDILRQVCTVASPSLQIECLETSYGILEALKNARRLQAVSVMTVKDDKYGKKFRADNVRVANLLSTESPSLTKLYFEDGGCISLEWLMKLLISSQQTLKELRLAEICPSQFSWKCPVLGKLSKLSVKISDGGHDDYEYIFQGEHGHKFPALKELELDIPDGFIGLNLTDGWFIVPSVKKIDHYGYIGKANIEDLAQIFPNVIEVQLRHHLYDFEQSWDIDPADIWSVGAFKKLEKLVVWPYTIQSPTKIAHNIQQTKVLLDFDKFKMLNMDSFLTGIPISICENLRKHPQQNLKDSQINEILRDSPSLLQLDNLKELIICARLEDASDELPEEPPFISMVSVRYALEMMPNLAAKFVYEPCIPAWNCYKVEDGEIAVTKLQTAFKHVQPHVELEPFFY